MIEKPKKLNIETSPEREELWRVFWLASLQATKQKPPNTQTLPYSNNRPCLPNIPGCA